jgi:DNA replication protein DnaC
MNEQTLEKMKKMKLYGMLRNFKQILEGSNMNSLTADELVLQLVESEWEDRHNRAVNRSIGNAKFRYKASIESIDYSIDRGLDQNIVNRLAECTFVKQAQNIIITGSTGTGKSYLASALGHQACLSGFKVYYANTLRLLAHLKMAKADGSSIKEFAYLEKQDILILDDFGIQPFDTQSRMILMDIIEDRHGKKSTIIAGQVPVGAWYDIIGDGTLADAILDRIVHDAHQIELNGESLRKKRNI